MLGAMDVHLTINQVLAERKPLRRARVRREPDRAAPAPRERRQFRRLDLRLPIVIQRLSGLRGGDVPATTANVSVAGVLVETIVADLEAGETVDVTLRLPADEGVWPFESRARFRGEVVRVEDGVTGSAVRRVAIRTLAPIRWAS